MGGKGMMGGKGDPLLNADAPPRFDAVMQHLEQCGRLADFVDQVEQTCAAQREPKSTLHDLELREAQVTSGIEQLLSKVKHGKLFEEETPKAGHSARSQLKAELTAAASKEEDAKIVEVAGELAQSKIKQTLKQGLALKPKHHPVEQVPERDRTKDLHVPTSTLRDHTAAELDKGLSAALALYGERRKQKKTLSIDEHKQISAMLRKIAAHLMKKVVHHHTASTKASAPAEPKPVVTPKPAAASKPVVTPKPAAAPKLAVSKPVNMVH